MRSSYKRPIDPLSRAFALVFVEKLAGPVVPIPKQGILNALSGSRLRKLKEQATAAKIRADDIAEGRDVDQGAGLTDRLRSWLSHNSRLSQADKLHASLAQEVKDETARISKVKKITAGTVAAGAAGTGGAIYLYKKRRAEQGGRRVVRSSGTWE